MSTLFNTMLSSALGRHAAPNLGARQEVSVDSESSLTVSADDSELKVHAERVAAYCERLMSMGKGLGVPKESARAAATMAHFVSHRWRFDRVAIARHLRLLGDEDDGYMRRAQAFGRRFEVLNGNVEFLYALEDAWADGQAVLRSIHTRLLDVGECDAHAAQAFFSFLDALVLGYYESTGGVSRSPGRRVAMMAVSAFCDARIHFQLHSDTISAAGLITAGAAARDAALEVARDEAVKRYAPVECTPNASAANRIASAMLSCVGEVPGRRLSRRARRFDEVRKVATKFARAEAEYRRLFSTRD